MSASKQQVNQHSLPPKGDTLTTTPPLRRIGKAPMRPETEPAHKEHKQYAADEPMTDPAEEQSQQTSSRLSELYVSNDTEAYQIDKHQSIQRKLMAQNPENREYVKKLARDLEHHRGDSLTKIFLTNAANTHNFNSDDISSAIIVEIYNILGSELDKKDIVVTALGRSGPYVVALSGDYAHTLVCEGSMELIDEATDPPVIQMFTVKHYSTQPGRNTTKETDGVAQEIAEIEANKMDFSIYFNLPADYTGGRDEKGELDFPKKKIEEALGEVFSNPEITYKLFQPRTELGFFRNTLRAVITMPRFEQTVPDQDMNVLSKLKFVALMPGARPATASISQDTRAIFKITNCCFRNTCNDEQGCTFRSERLREISYRPITRNMAMQRMNKREREAEQAAKREDKFRRLQQLKMARRNQEMCKMYLEGKCDKTRDTCRKGLHGSMIFSKTIACASSKESSDWICRLGDQCPYSCHINPK